MGYNMRKTVCLLLISLCLITVLCTINGAPASAAPISTVAQQVVDELEQKGFDVTFVYFGSERELTFATENCAIVAMLTHEHFKNFQFTTSQEEQYREGNTSLAKAYPNAEVFIVALMEDLDNNGFPDGAGDGVRAQGVYQISGGVYGGRTQTNFIDNYWINAGDYVNGNASSPAPTMNPTPQPTPQPQNGSTLELSCQGSSSYLNLKVDITGRLTAKNAGIPAAQILLSYSVNAGNSWVDLTTAITDADGAFTEVWRPQATGYYLLKAAYAGDSDHTNVTKVVNFAVAPCQEQNVFSLTSNSTVTSLLFNSTSQELSFTVNGDQGTTGYVSIYVPKTLVSDPSTLKVYLDEAAVAYTAVDKGDSVMVTFTYHHSTHQVTIAVGSQATGPNTEEANLLILAGVIAAFAIAVAVLVVVFRAKRHPAKPFF